MKLPSEASIDSSFSSVGFSVSSASASSFGTSSVGVSASGVGCSSVTGFDRVLGEPTAFPPLDLFGVPRRATPRPRPIDPLCKIQLNQ